MPCVNCDREEHPCILANVPAPPAVEPHRRPPPITLLPMPPCMGCQASEADCRWELAYPDQTLHVKLFAIAWPGTFNAGNDGAETAFFDERAVWFDPKDAEVVD